MFAGCKLLIVEVLFGVEEKKGESLRGEVLARKMVEFGILLCFSDQKKKENSHVSFHRAHTNRLL